MREIKVGDKVKALASAPDITEGKEYDVCYVRADCIEVLDNAGDANSLLVKSQWELVGEPSFDDLIDVAIKAHKDGLIHKVEIVTRRSIYMREKPYSKEVHYNLLNSDKGIDFINSLYAETFVIERVEDISRINVFKVPIFELSNGIKGTIQQSENERLFSVQFEDNTWGDIGYMILKGATVTQKRGE